MELGDVKLGLAQYKQYVLRQEQSTAHFNNASYKFESNDFNNVSENNSSRLSQMLIDIQCTVNINEQLLLCRLMLLAAFAAVIICVAIYTYRSTHKITTVVDEKVDSLTNLYP